MRINEGLTKPHLLLILELKKSCKCTTSRFCKCTTNNYERSIEGIQHKLMLKQLEFDYSIEYKKGIDNTATDALSRQFQQNNEDSCSSLTQVIPAWELGSLKLQPLMKEMLLAPSFCRN
jgi:hypothetical protein